MKTNTDKLIKVSLIVLIAFNLTACADALKTLTAYSMNTMIVISFLLLFVSLIAKSPNGMQYATFGLILTYALAYFFDYIRLGFPFVSAILN
ncbi:hypothetical protein [Acinetobacter calcoaceticus]|uniref:hypothetical protein n=1 Tax=Acinetobacter calcoaceticus TaxID=471 RepID=UPI00124CF011|nr:hypothetical protein [Acinetobacter calcoaceticus]